MCSGLRCSPPGTRLCPTCAGSARTAAAATPAATGSSSTRTSWMEVGCRGNGASPGPFWMLTSCVTHEGSLLCGWLRVPSVLMCEDEDWDVIGQGPANRICGAGLSYSEQQRSFELDFGGEKFTISKKATQLGLTGPVQTQTECSGSVQLTALCLATAGPGRTTRPPSSASRPST